MPDSIPRPVRPRRRCQRRIGWAGAALFMALYALVLGVMLHLGRPIYEANLHDALEARMLAWDEWHSEEVSYPQWLGNLMDIDATPQMLRGWIKESDKRNWSSDSLRIG